MKNAPLYCYPSILKFNFKEQYKLIPEQYKSKQLLKQYNLCHRETLNISRKKAYSQGLDPIRHSFQANVRTYVHNYGLDTEVKYVWIDPIWNDSTDEEIEQYISDEVWKRCMHDFDGSGEEFTKYVHFSRTRSGVVFIHCTGFNY